jgi:hypothetical protein
MLSGCASYQPKDFKSLNYEPGATLCAQKSPQNANGANVKVYALALSSAKTKYYFDRDICAKGYKVVQFTIVNNSDRCFVLDNDNIGATTADSAQVANLVHTSTAGRAGGYALGSLLIFPLIIPAVVDGVKSSKANTQLDADFAARCAEICHIPAHATKNHVIFIHNGSFTRFFELSLVDREDDNIRLNYNIDL